MRRRFQKVPNVSKALVDCFSSEKKRKPLYGSPRCSVTHAPRDVNATSFPLFRNWGKLKFKPAIAVLNRLRV